MNRTRGLIYKSLQVLPNLDQLIEGLKSGGGIEIPRDFSGGESTREIMHEIPDIEYTIKRQRELIPELSRSALEKVSLDGEDADLSPAEQLGLEAIILIVGRPAILIQDGKFFPPPQGWEFLEDARAEIERTFKSVGRIEVLGHPSMDWIGTGFLVAEDVVMTNRHVAREFCRSGESGQWTFETWARPRIDYVEEFSTQGSAEFSLDKIIYVSEYPSPDLALFKVSSNLPAGMTAPEPLKLASFAPTPTTDRKVYVVGYPAWDPYRNDPETMRLLFSNIYGVKRLQPGALKNIYEHQNMFTHDCSTLGGNSGSCVVDLETNHVIGLHFSGRWLEENNAVALWTLINNPQLKQAGVNFVPHNGRRPSTKPNKYNARVKILNIQLDEIQTPLDVQSKKLVAEIRFQITGPDTTKLTADRAPVKINIGVFDLASNASIINASEQYQFDPQVFEYTSRLQFRFPGSGQYELRSNVNVDAQNSTGENIGATYQGPTFKVISP